MTLRGRSVRLKPAIPAIVILTLTGITFQFVGIRINASPSLPIGLYVTTSDQTAKLVEFCPAEPFASLSISREYREQGRCPDGAEPLMKPIVAVVGDTVEFSKQGVAVNGKLLPNSAVCSFDTKTRLLTHWPYGKYHVSAGTLWVVSSYNARSFDSRYFGPILSSSIQSHLRPLLTE